VPSIEDNCIMKMIVLMAKVSNFSKENQFMRDSSKMDFVMVLAGPFPARVKYIRALFTTIAWTEKASFHGLTVGSTKEVGLRIKNTAKENTSGLTVKSMMATLETTTVKALEPYIIPTERCMSATGSRVKNMV